MVYIIIVDYRHRQGHKTIIQKVFTGYMATK
ncbi:hypothetical protein FHS10_004428 [Mucilaginibacter dorajii]|nr:hypothetical protein [Mucilaginibacter dorajii]